MKRMILVTGGIFFLLLLGFVYVCEHADVTSLTDLCNLQFGTGMGALGFGEKLHLHVLRDAPILEHVQCPRLSHGTIGLPHQNSPSFDGKRGSFSLGPPCFVQKVARE